MRAPPLPLGRTRPRPGLPRPHRQLPPRNHLLEQGLLEHDGARDVLAQAGGGHQQLTVGAAGVLSVLQADGLQALAAGGVGLIHGQDTAAGGGHLVPAWGERSVRADHRPPESPEQPGLPRAGASGGRFRAPGAAATAKDASRRPIAANAMFRGARAGRLQRYLLPALICKPPHRSTYAVEMSSSPYLSAFTRTLRARPWTGATTPDFMERAIVLACS
jgi:hypothetical protein